MYRYFGCRHGKDCSQCRFNTGDVSGKWASDNADGKGTSFICGWKACKTYNKNRVLLDNAYKFS